MESFAGFSASTVSDEQIQAARDCIHGGGPPSARYAQVPFDRIMNQNQVGGGVFVHMCLFLSVS